MKLKVNILVTGCGGDIGQSVGKILQSTALVNSAIGCDVSDEHAGRFIFNRMYRIAACSKPEYTSDIDRITAGEKIDFILPMSEPELRMLTAQCIETSFRGKPLICANLKARQIGFDKYETARFLQSVGLPFPETQIVNKVDSPRFPLILKSRNGSGSKSIFVVQAADEFAFFQKKYPDFVAQELITDSPDEFTCGLYRTVDGSIRSIIYKRRLVDSYSGFGEVVENEAVTRLLHTVAEQLDLRGAINVQLKLSAKGPLVFEINPRFSSTVLFRHLMGFQDLVWSVEEAMGQAPSAYTAPTAGTRFYKGFNEYIA